MYQTHFGLGSFKFLAAFGYYPIIKAGILDSLSLGMFTVLVFFLVFFYHMARWPRNVCLLGVMFIAGLFATRCLQVIGMFDGLLHYPLAWQVIDLSLLILALFVLIVGIVSLRDWVVGKIKPDSSAPRLDLERLFPPIISAGSAEPLRPRLSCLRALKITGQYLGLILLSFLTGCLAALMACAWAENASVWFILYELSLPGKAPQAFLMLMSYGFIFIWPICTLWIALCWIRHSDFFFKHLKARFPAIRILVSAIFIGYALGILRLYFDFYF